VSEVEQKDELFVIWTRSQI